MTSVSQRTNNMYKAQDNQDSLKQHATHPIICEGLHFIRIAANISLREEAWALGTSLTPPLAIAVSVPSQESDLSCIYVLQVSTLYFMFINKQYTYINSNKN